jgi:hypothetical protein
MNYIFILKKSGAIFFKKYLHFGYPSYTLNLAPFLVDKFYAVLRESTSTPFANVSK